MSSYREQMRNFPIKQMVVISIIWFSEPLALASLFPYFYFMIRDFHIAPTEEEISKYSGYLASSFSFFQFLFALQWGKLSNHIGRNPILLFGLFSSSLSLFIFGFSTSYFLALASRCLAGPLNGNIAVLRTMVGEICVEKIHQAIGFPYDNIPYDNSPYDNSPYDNSPYDKVAYDNRSYDNSPYDNSPYDNSPYDNIPYVKVAYKKYHVI